MTSKRSKMPLTNMVTLTIHVNQPLMSHNYLHKEGIDSKQQCVVKTGVNFSEYKGRGGIVIGRAPRRISGNDF